MGGLRGETAEEVPDFSQTNVILLGQEIQRCARFHQLSAAATASVLVIAGPDSLRSPLDYERGLNGRDLRLPVREPRDLPHVPAVASRCERVRATALPPSSRELESRLIHPLSEDALAASEELELVGRRTRCGRPGEGLARRCDRTW